ncbi:MAG TPA: Nmad5 family putative nucleotide modification protein [Anaerolineae bacterium]|nr:Nmad5 family putative nucleotide modification protein [Anaerolineae bacterium]
MKLTNYVRDAYITSVMNDVPRERYEEMLEKAILDDAIAQLPGPVRAIWKNPDFQGYLGLSSVCPVQKAGCVQVPCLNPKNFRLSDVAMHRVLELVALREEQAARRNSLRTRLRSIAYGCSTRKALAEALPEFEKYLPKEEETSRNLPVIANVVTDFVKAGWPKGAKK